MILRRTLGIKDTVQETEILYTMLFRVILSKTRLARYIYRSILSNYSIRKRKSTFLIITSILVGKQVQLCLLNIQTSSNYFLTYL